jgi:hypothetical protein
MKSLNPSLVRVSDGRVGCLVARLGLQGCITFGRQRVLETHALTSLGYFHWMEVDDEHEAIWMAS